MVLQYLAEEDGTEERKEGRKKARRKRIVLFTSVIFSGQSTLRVHISGLSRLLIFLHATHIPTFHQHNQLSLCHLAPIFLPQTTGFLGRLFFEVEVALK